MKREIKPRRRMIVNAEVQFDVLMYVGVFVFALFLSQIAACYLFINRIESISGMGDFQSMSIAEFIMRYKTVFLVYQTIPIIVGLVVGYWYFNHMTRKIVGPIFNIRRTIKKSAEEDPGATLIHLRSDDYFQDLADDINAILQKKTK